MATWQTQVKNIAMAVAVLSAIAMALSVGIGEAAQVVINPNSAENPLNQTTIDTFGGTVSFVDRVAVLGVFTTILGGAGLGILRPGPENPPFLSTLVRYMPVIIGLVAFTAFSTEVWDILGGNRDWDASSDAVNSYMLFLASSFVAGLVTLFRK